MSVLNNFKIRKANKELRKILNSQEAMGKILEEKYISAVCWGKMYTKELFENAKIKFDKDMKIGEDFKFMIPIIENCKTIAIDTKQQLYHYRLNQQSITQQKGNKNLWLQEILLSHEIMEWIKEKHPSIRYRAMQRYVRVNITFLVKMIKDNNVNLEEEIKQVQNNIKGYEFQYIFMTSSKIQDKIKLILIKVYPSLFVKLYRLRVS